MEAAQVEGQELQEEPVIEEQQVVDPNEQLRVELDQLRSEHEKLSKQYGATTNEFSNLKSLYGRQANELGDLRKFVAAFQETKSEPKTSKRRVAALGDPLIDSETFTQAVEDRLNYLEDLYEETKKQATESSRKEIETLRQQLGDLQKAQLYSMEEAELRNMGLTDDDLADVQAAQQQYDLPSLKSALGYSTAWQKLKQKPAPASKPAPRRQIDPKQVSRELANSGTGHRNGAGAIDPSAGDWKAELAAIMAVPGGYRNLPEAEKERFRRLADQSAVNGAVA